MEAPKANDSKDIKQAFHKEWEQVDALLPDSQISEDEIMEAVRAVRYGNKNLKLQRD